MLARICLWLMLSVATASAIRAAPVEIDRHGAVGDGATDDSTAFNAVLGGQQPGTTVLSTAGKAYRIAASVEIPSGVTLDCGIANGTPAAWAMKSDIRLDIEPGRDGGCCAINFAGSIWLDSNPVALKLGRGLMAGATDIHFDAVQIVGAGSGADREQISGGLVHITRLEINADRSTANCVAVDGGSVCRFCQHQRLWRKTGQRGKKRLLSVAFGMSHDGPAFGTMMSTMIDSARLQLPEFAGRSVWLVGAGPGDPGLLSALALHALGYADTVVYDALVDRRILALARPGAVLENAGKRGGRPSPSQPDISGRLILLAREGQRVLRLKGGDPCVFGRGGEEALALAAARIPFRIVPGITAGIGGLAYAGIPVTHRDIASAVTFVTGHEQGGDVPEGLDWGAIAKGSPVIVVYMGLNHLGRIAARLVAAGRSPDEPVAIISKATTPDQRIIVSTLAEAAASTAASGIEGPTIIVIGEVVRLRAALDWLGGVSPI